MTLPWWPLGGRIGKSSRSALVSSTASVADDAEGARRPVAALLVFLGQGTWSTRRGNRLQKVPQGPPACGPFPQYVAVDQVELLGPGQRHAARGEASVRHKNHDIRPVELTGGAVQHVQIRSPDR